MSDAIFHHNLSSVVNHFSTDTQKNNGYSNEYNTVDILLSIIVGLVLGIILYRGYICPPIVRGPNSRDIIDKIFEVDGKYYELEPKVCGCLKK